MMLVNLQIAGTARTGDDPAGTAVHPEGVAAVRTIEREVTGVDDV